MTSDDIDTCTLCGMPDNDGDCPCAAFDSDADIVDEVIFEESW